MAAHSQMIYNTYWGIETLLLYQELWLKMPFIIPIEELKHNYHGYKSWHLTIIYNTYWGIETRLRKVCIDIWIFIYNTYWGIETRFVKAKV